MAEDHPTLCIPNSDGSCSICADEALPGVIVSLNPSEGTAEVSVMNELTTVALDLVENAVPGDSVMVHMGFAISRVAGTHR